VINTVPLNGFVRVRAVVPLNGLVKLMPLDGKEMPGIGGKSIASLSNVGRGGIVEEMGGRFGELMGGRFGA
jgi:hypothetical protein